MHRALNPGQFKQTVLWQAPRTRYFLCAGSVVHAALIAGSNAGQKWGASSFVIDGFGVLSGEDMERTGSSAATTARGSGLSASLDKGGNSSPQGITWAGVVNSSMSGVTLVDFPNHHLILGGGSKNGFNELHGVKILGWRANGDGLHVFQNWHVSDLFMRTQGTSALTITRAHILCTPPAIDAISRFSADCSHSSSRHHAAPRPPHRACVRALLCTYSCADDSMYLDSGGGTATTFDRVTTWNDANGCAFIYSAGGGDTSTNVLRDSTAIYARASWAWWSGGRIFGLRQTSTGRVMVRC